MKKEKIINSVYYLFSVVVIIGFILGIISFDFTFLTVSSIILIVIVLPLDGYRQKLKEAKNPLNVKRICEALSSCSEERRGAKSDFINLYGEELYNHFLTKGYIHEPYEQNGFVWELTKLGLRVRTELSS